MLRYCCTFNIINRRLRCLPAQLQAQGPSSKLTSMFALSEMIICHWYDSSKRDLYMLECAATMNLKSLKRRWSSYQSSSVGHCQWRLCTWGNNQTCIKKISQSLQTYLPQFPFFCITYLKAWIAPQCSSIRDIFTAHSGDDWAPDISPKGKFTNPPALQGRLTTS